MADAEMFYHRVIMSNPHVGHTKKHFIFASHLELAAIDVQYIWLKAQNVTEFSTLEALPNPTKFIVSVQPQFSDSNFIPQRVEGESIRSHTFGDKTSHRSAWPSE